MKNKSPLAKQKNQPAEKTASHTIVQSEVRAVSYSGPLPPPEHLAQYNAIVPGAAERILAMAEREQEFQHKAQETALTNERRTIDATVELANKDLARLDRGQWMAFALSLLSYSIAGYGVFQSEPAAAVVGLITGTALLAGKFLKSKEKDDTTEGR